VGSKDQRDRKILSKYIDQLRNKIRTKISLNKSDKSTFRILVPIRHPVGGIRTYLKYTYRHLDKDLYEFTLLAPYKDFLERLKKDLNGLNLKTVYTGREASALSMLSAMFKNLYLNKYDLIHSQGFTAGIITVFANLLWKIPHLMTSHDVFRDDLFYEKFSFLQKKIMEIIFKNVTIIQSVTYDAQNNLLQYLPGLKVNSKKLIVIRNGVDIEEFLERDSKKRQEIFIHKNNDQFVIGFIGRFMPQKGFIYLIEIVNHLSKLIRTDQKFKVVCVGGYGGFIREYKKAIGESGLMNYFEFIDFQENVNSVLRQMNILAMPSLWEAYGLVAVEALLCGTPIVTFSCIGLREILNDTPAIMVPVRDSEAMAREIVKVINDYQNVKYQFDAFVPEAKRRFDVRAAAYSLERVFKGLIGR